MIVWGFIAIAFVAVLIFPKRWLAAAFAVGFAAIGLSGMYYENIPPDPAFLATGIVLFAAIFFGLLVGAISLRNRLVKFLRTRT